ncbi:primosomal protein N' [Nocardioides yefusunii]|uniref:Probable replication restart protein PriA n=1 Tax=Nocardioides yefusunii TaxID=2500546 RepID=A0ABW1QUF6_9ACTN|nr:primosomal protein N' [Nocardioides yefusunii]
MSDIHEAGQLDMLPGLRDSVRAVVRQEVDKARSSVSRRDKKRAADAEPAETNPIARVLVDVPVAHLDRPFDYLVPKKYDEDCRPGVRVKVPFGGQDVDGFVLERGEESDHVGQLRPLRRVVSPEPVLTPEIADLTEQIAARYAGARADVLRLAVPPRHATAEAEAPEAVPGVVPTSVHDAAAAEQAWSMHTHGPAFVQHLAAGESPRAVWQAVPGTDWATLVAHAAAATAASGRGVVICVPDHRDVARVSAALHAVAGPESHAVLAADVGPAARYTAFLAALRGTRRIVVGTRSAAFAPVRDLGLVVIWDDGDDHHSEQRAPYPHAREVLLTRALSTGAASLVGGFTRTVEAEYLVRTGFAREIAGDRAVVRQAALVDAHWLQDRSVATRIPQRVVQMMKQALAEGPVLVQTPRTGYLPTLACERCRTPARCSACTGPLHLDSPIEPPSCRWCGQTHPGWRCTECGHHGMRAPVIGRDRTAEELGRLLPGVTVRSSGGDRILDSIGTKPVVVVATPGAEPVAEGGYAAVVLLDVWLSLGRAELRADEEVLRKWLNAAGLVRTGARVAVVGDPSLPVIQALVRWDPAGFAAREIETRVETHLPPAVRMATVTGTEAALEEALRLVDMPDVVEVLGPVPVDEDAVPNVGDEPQMRYVLRVPRAMGATLSQALGDMQRARAAHRATPVRVRVDPLSL